MIPDGTQRVLDGFLGGFKEEPRGVLLQSAPLARCGHNAQYEVSFPGYTCPRDWACRVFISGGGGGSIEPPKTGGGGWEKGSIDRHHSR